MSDDFLSDEERNALRASMQESARERAPAPSRTEAAPEPVALVAEDRAAERARPAARRLANRWAKLAGNRLRRIGIMDVDFALENVSLIRPAALRVELEGGWGGELEIPGRKASTWVWVSGPAIEAFIAQLLGDAEPSETRAIPSSIALRVFDEVGGSLVESYGATWAQEEGCQAEDGGPVGPSEVLRALEDEAGVLVATLELSGTTSGTVRLIGPARAFVNPPRPARAVPASREVVRSVLGEVPVELRVELGRGRLTARELARLAPGTVIPLQRMLGDHLSLFIGDRIRAHVQPLVEGESLAAEVRETVAMTARKKR